MIKLGILGSTRGSNLTPIIEAINAKILHAQVNLILSNKSDAGILEKAKHYQIPHSYIDAAGLSREAYDELISSQLRQHDVDLIVLIGYMRILSKQFVSTWQNKIINVHPSLLPNFAGLMDLHVHESVLAQGHTVTGCSVHMVTEEVDAGPVLVQQQCHVDKHDTPATLKVRVQSLEGPALVQAIQQISINSAL